MEVWNEWKWEKYVVLISYFRAEGEHMNWVLNVMWKVHNEKKYIS